MTTHSVLLEPNSKKRNKPRLYTTKLVSAPAISRTHPIPAATTRTSRPGTSMSTAPSSTHAITVPITTVVSRHRA
ncbi:hypothetical protein WG66_008114 [Moniliophthora roreri]|nr:hypothetical protein WG66_008114 [Moniliophthora roreri]